MKLRPCLAAALFLAVSLPAAAQKPHTQPRPITIDDLFQIREVSDPQLSPDAQFVAYAVKMLLLKEDKPEERIWEVPTAGGNAIPMTAEGVSSSHPRWSPDGKYLAFLSARNEGKTQIWLLNRSGGEAQHITDTPQDVDDFAWSPDSARLVVILRDASEEELAAAKAKDKEKDDKAIKARVRARDNQRQTQDEVRVEIDASKIAAEAQREVEEALRESQREIQRAQVEIQRDIQRQVNDQVRVAVNRRATKERW